MEHKRIYLCLAHMSGNEQKYIQEAFDTNWVVPLGPNVNGFENDLAEFVGGEKDIVALSSGTAAVHLALLACGVGQGDEVIVQSFTFCASSHPITYLGATPVFVDSEEDTWNMDPILLKEAIVDRIAKTGKKPKAIVPVYLYGMPAKIDEIMAVANEFDIPVIEDAAEGFGSKYKGKVCGTFGKFGVLSFNGNKMITTSGGGAMICENKAAKDEIMFYATQAREAFPYYQHEKIGYNYRLSNICAGIGRGQMTVAAEHIAHHKHVYELYCELLKDVEGISIHKNAFEGCDSNFWLNTITIDPSIRVQGEENAYAVAVQGAVGGAAGVTHKSGSIHTDCEPNTNVEAMRIYLDAAGIESRPLWKPMHKQPVYAKSPAYVNGVSESLFKKGMCLPSGPMVTDEDVKYIVGKIKECIKIEQYGTLVASILSKTLVR
ncbi:dTDP-4-amino-4,6-dideoxygalactose transaminase [Bacteroides luti]|uniref:dTDP-4-amino-4,6-dideoxygalactose transaminase n=1 Tax=Bacteroides luti TaxID=1297750 RepID=A0A1M4WGU7_9BACE|nr:aminotransferase class I/II-fold pyridoxal phosphate-dependent enzyme [Bacteroides luti]SHE80468.1 dTDP-4-amino-4,6-dideoxygalactose transaminase [Bacteroides luti]